MKDLSTVSYHPVVDQLSKILCERTRSDDPSFFRIMASYYIVKVASMMRCSIATPDRGKIPVSMYAINLATSGHGKGHSMNIFEDSVIKAFRSRFLQSTFPEISTKNINNRAVKRANRFGSDPDEMKEQMTADFEHMGPLLFSFDSGTPAAVKQMRDKLLMAGAGSMNLEIDEIGSNLIGQTEILNAFLELFDVGKLKQKLLKSTNDNKRLEEIQGKTPTNMLLFGTPNKLMDGGKTEEETISFLEIGFARRCIFGYSLKSRRSAAKTAEEIFKTLTSKTADKYLQKVSHDMETLADSLNFGITLTMQKPVALELLRYRLDCEKRAEELPEHQDIQRAELEHRYFKAMKLAGGYAFIDKSHEILERHLWQAVKLVEDSGKALHQLLNRERAHVKLAKYIAGVGEDVTHSDIAEDLPLYKGSSAAKAELMKYAIGWGYKNNVIIKSFETDGIEFFRGEALHEVNLKEINVAYSTDVAVGYQNDVIPFNEIGTLTGASGYHWINHHLGDIM